MLRDTSKSSTPIAIGQTLEARVSGIKEYGVFVNIANQGGLCHKSAIPPSIMWSKLTPGTLVKVVVLAIREDGKLSLQLDMVVSDQCQLSRDPAPPAINGALAGHMHGYTKAIEKAVDAGVSGINAVGTQYRNNASMQRAGFVAEADHAATFNVDAAFQAKPVEAVRLSSQDGLSPDIVVTDQGQKVAEVSSKVYKSAPDTAQQQRPYAGQKRLVPKDQHSDVVDYARKRALKEANGSPGRPAVAKEFQEVADNATSTVKHDGVSSKARTRSESQDMGNKAKDGKVTGADIVGDIGERALQGAKQGAKAGGIAGAAISAGFSTVKAIKDVRAGKKSAAEASLEVGKNAALGGIEGMIKGGASGAAQAGARVLAEKAASQTAKRILGGSAPAVIVITALDVAKHAVETAAGRKTGEEFKQAAKSSVVAGGTSYIGAEIGFMIGGPVGALVGGIAAPMIVDKSQEMGLGSRLDRFFSANTAPGHHGGTVEHLRQLHLLLDGLSGSNAVVFPDRLIRTSGGGHTSVELVIAHGRSIYLVEFRAWKGHLDYGRTLQEVVVPSRFLWWDTSTKRMVPTDTADKSTILQIKEDRYGINHQKQNSNPLKSIGYFASRMKKYLYEFDRRWEKMRLTHLVVFPDESVTLTGLLAKDPQFMKLGEFLERLHDNTTVTPQWQLDSLSRLPTWDAVQDFQGCLYQGLIETASFGLSIDNETIDIPFNAIIKAEVSERGSSFSRNDRVSVLLRSGQFVEGLVEKQPIVLNRKGHRTEFLMRDLQLVCPANMILSDF